MFTAVVGENVIGVKSIGVDIPETGVSIGVENVVLIGSEIGELTGEVYCVELLGEE